MTAARQFAWLTSPTDRYPKGKFHRSNKMMLNDEMLRNAANHHCADGCYQSTYEFTTWNGGELNAETAKSAIIDRIYLDLDNYENPQAAMDDAMEVAWYIGNHIITYYSGQKGVGMLIKCNPAPLIPEMKSAVLRRFTYTLIAACCEIVTADAAVIGDLNRVHRIIDTRHQKTKLYAIGLHQRELSDLTIDEVKEMAVRPRNLVQKVQPSAWVSQQLLNIEETILIERLKTFVGRKMLAQTTFDSIVENMSIASRGVVFEFIRSLDDEWQCTVAKNAPRGEYKNWWLEEAEEKLRSDGQLTNGRDRGLEHKKRVGFVKFAHKCGMSFGEICSAFVNVVDGHGQRCYDKEMTEQQVRSCIR